MCANASLQRSALPKVAATKLKNNLRNISNEHQLAKVLITGTLPQSNQQNVQFIFQPLPNLIFTRDISIVINDHLLLSKAATEARERESLLMRYIVFHELFTDQQENVIEINESSDFFLLDDAHKNERKTSLEGGDIMMIAPNHLLVGCSERTTISAINKIIHALFQKQNRASRKYRSLKSPASAPSCTLILCLPMYAKTFGYCLDALAKN